MRSRNEELKTIQIAELIHLKDGDMICDTSSKRLVFL